MAIEDYLQALKATRTHQTGVYAVHEYASTRRWGLIRELPEVPRADRDRHVIILEVVGDEPILCKVLTDRNHTMSLTRQDADRLLFVFVGVRPRSLQIPSPEEGFRLRDGDDTACDTNLTYQVEDAEAFWRGGEDPVAALEDAAVDVVRSFFLGMTSESLVQSPEEVKRALEEEFVDHGMTRIKNNLEERIRQDVWVPGVKLNAVNVKIIPSVTLSEHLQRIRKRIHGPGGLAERKRVDRLIDMDQTYAPYGLRDVIRFLDMRLLEDFYKKDNWTEAMASVADAFAKKKDEYLRAGDRMSKFKKFMADADELDLDTQDKQDMREKIGAKVLEMLDDDEVQPGMSDRAYLEAAIDLPTSSGRLTKEQPKVDDGSDDDGADAS